MNIHARAYHYGKLIQKSGFAEKQLAVFVCKLLVPGICKVYGSGSDTRTYPAVFRSVLEQHAVLLGFRHVVRVGAAGTVVCSIAAYIANRAAFGIFAEAYGRDIFKVMEGARHKVDDFGERDLGDELVPSFIVERSAGHIGEIEVYRRIAVYEKVDILLAVFCFEIYEVVLHYLFKTRTCRYTEA